MHTHLNKPVMRRLTATWVSLSLLLTPLVPTQSIAGTARKTSAPQILFAVTNSQSMDGTTSGAIMVGSGSLSAEKGDSSLDFLNATSSPVNYTVPDGFTAPLSNHAPGQTAPYTYTSGGVRYDNGPSRLNIAKQAIKAVVAQRGDEFNFGLYTYDTSNAQVYDTWVYFMSQDKLTDFVFTNTASADTVGNPCFNYRSTLGSTTRVYRACDQVRAAITGYDVNTFRYLRVGISSDAPNFNDVLYSTYSTGGGLPPVFTMSGPTGPSNSLTDFNNGNISVRFASTSYGSTWTSSPTNAGTVPSTKQVMRALRGFGYGGSQSATTGRSVVDILTGTNAQFNAALAPETDVATTAEVKAVAGQSPIAGLMRGAKTYLDGVRSRQSLATCQKQYVMLITDGLPTLDLNGKRWPPIGTAAAQAYVDDLGNPVTATFNVGADGATTVASSNSVALKDAIAQIQALNTAGIKVYVIGMGAGVDPELNPDAAKTLAAMATAGGTGRYFPAKDAAELMQAVNSATNAAARDSAVSAPIAPLTVAGGDAYLYSLTSDTTLVSGHVTAYSVQSNGTPNGTPVWDAGALMNATLRSSRLYSTNATGAVVLLSDLDAAAFALPATKDPCVPTTAKVVEFTVNPSITFTPSGSSTCNYLGDRRPNWFLGGFSRDSAGRYVGPSANSLLTNDATYVTYARSISARVPMVLFSNNDGFIYAVHARTGELLWAWMPRAQVAQLQNYSSFQTSEFMNGNFAVVDAKDGSGNWGTYLVGSARGGAQRFSVKLDHVNMSFTEVDGSGNESTVTRKVARPSTVVYDQVTSGTTSPGDQNVGVGNAPLHQSPTIAYRNGSAFYLYTQVTTAATPTATFTELNVATGTGAAQALSFVPSSQIEYVQSRNQIWMGGSDGTVRVMGFSGNGANDVATLTTMFSTLNVTDTTKTVSPIIYVGYTETAGVPYAYALNKSQVNVFSVKSDGWVPIWSATSSAGYTYSTTTRTFTANASLTSMSTGGVISDAPLVIGDSIVLPVHVPATDNCGPGTAYYNFFSLSTGSFPAVPFTYRGNNITGHMLLGDGFAFTPNATQIQDGSIALYGGTNRDENESGNGSGPRAPLLSKVSMGNGPVAWRRL